MPSTFPLFRLPNDERLAVLRQTKSNHLFLLSLVSKRAKILVTSANRKAQAVVVSVERKIQFSCHTFQNTGFAVELSIWKTPNEPRKVKKPKYVTIFEASRRAKPIKYKKEEYEVEDWLEHLCQYFIEETTNSFLDEMGPVTISTLSMSISNILMNWVYTELEALITIIEF